MLRVFGLLYSAVTGRSPRWPAVRRAYLAVHPCCAACGRDDDLDVHHVRPHAYYPELELDPSNLVTLCRLHHLVFGHCGDWSCYNPRVRQDAGAYLRSVAGRMTAREDVA